MRRLYLRLTIGSVSLAYLFSGEKPNNAECSIVASKALEMYNELKAPLLNHTTIYMEYRVQQQVQILSDGTEKLVLPSTARYYGNAEDEKEVLWKVRKILNYLKEDCGLHLQED